VDCGAPLDRGICQARSVEPESEAFYYDARENKCVLFIYSGLVRVVLYVYVFEECWILPK